MKTKKKLSSIADFRAYTARLNTGRAQPVATMVIPSGTCGIASGAGELAHVARKEIAAKKLDRTVRLRVTGCHGFCQMEPSVLVEPAGTFYPRVGAHDMPRIVDAVAGGKVLQELLYRDPHTGQRIEKQNEIGFFRQQMRTILARSEKVDPTQIGDYLMDGGYEAFVKALGGSSPKQVCAEVKASGLRGRGGAGFLTGRKWEMLANQPDGRGKIIVCNADEGDPGAYMDRSVLEGNPHSIIEGMLIGAFATGANEGVMYVRTEYPLAIKHVLIALDQARAMGLLGGNIFGTGFSFDISLVKGAGAFVCGEETALIRSIQGKMGEPRQRPPFPVQKGVDNKPTAINNVETWANISLIIRKGAAEYSRIGTKNNAGTKIFSLVGKVKNTGLVEVPMGITIDAIVHGIGAGSSGKTRIKAVQTGGPSGGCIPASNFHLPIDYDSLAGAGSIMGSGGMIVMDEETCMVDVAKYFTGFLKDESCGKCFTCRKGTQRMHELLDEITDGKGSIGHLKLLEELALAVKDTTMCGLGQTASNPVLSTLRHFRSEYLAHIEQKRCPAGVCRTLVSYSIGETCTGCGACAKACPQKAVGGEPRRRYVIDKNNCIKCGMCRSVCKASAVHVQ